MVSTFALTKPGGGKSLPLVRDFLELGGGDFLERFWKIYCGCIPLGGDVLERGGGLREHWRIDASWCMRKSSERFNLFALARQRENCCLKFLNGRTLDAKSEAKMRHFFLLFTSSLCARIFFPLLIDWQSTKQKTKDIPWDCLQRNLLDSSGAMEQVAMFYQWPWRLLALL